MSEGQCFLFFVDSRCEVQSRSHARARLPYMDASVPTWRIAVSRQESLGERVPIQIPTEVLKLAFGSSYNTHLQVKMLVVNRRPLRHK